jgi:hypothetical protein
MATPGRKSLGPVKITGEKRWDSRSPLKKLSLPAARADRQAALVAGEIWWPCSNRKNRLPRSRQSAKPCRSPAVRGHSVCRMHGAGGGALNGNRNAFKHGEFAAETLALKKEINALARMARETMGAIE